MKKLLGLIAVSLVSVITWADAGVKAYPLTYTEAVLTKNSADQNGMVYLASPKGKWCLETNAIAHFDSFSAAQAIEGLADGLYVCTGEFVQGPFNSAVQIFKIGGCSAIAELDLKKSCI